MKIAEHKGNNVRVAEILSDDFIINTAEEGVDLAGTLNYDGYDCVLIHKENINPLFFDLSTKMLGEVVQKFSNFRLRLCIIGAFDGIESLSLRQFITESNKGNQINFFPDTFTALKHFIPEQ